MAPQSGVPWLGSMHHESYVRSRSVVALLVQEVSAVARHAHALQRDHHAPLIGLGQMPVLAPLHRDARDDLAVLLMMFALLRCHGDEELLLEPFRKLRQDFLLAPPHHDGRERGRHPIEIAVAGHPSVLVFRLVRVEETVRGSKPERIDEVDDRHQLLEPVLERRAGENDGVIGGDSLDRSGGARRPVLDALRLVEDHQIGSPAADAIEIGVNGVVVRDLEEGLFAERAARAGMRPSITTRGGRRRERSPATIGV
ncbi:MAG TPA: hypothetical protein VF713_13625 [Thermoanaerobaculia bacterium]